MTFDEILTRVITLLQQEGRVSYRALKIRFNLDDEYLEGLKDELIEAKQLASDERGKVLVWTGGTAEKESEDRRNGETGKNSPESSVQSLASRPAAYTPKHLVPSAIITPLVVRAAASRIWLAI